jgi:hypothetical protein
MARSIALPQVASNDPSGTGSRRTPRRRVVSARTHHEPRPVERQRVHHQSAAESTYVPASRSPCSTLTGYERSEMSMEVVVVPATTWSGMIVA